MKFSRFLYQKLTTLSALVGVFLASTTMSSHAQALPPGQDKSDGPRYRPGELLIQFKKDITDAQLADLFQRGGLRLRKHIQTAAMKGNGQLGITLTATPLPVEETIQMLRNHPAIEFVQPNWIYTHQAVSDDPFYTDGSLWGMYGDATSPANQYGSQAGEPWAAGYTGSRDVYIGVIDEGIQFDHPDLEANIWTNPGEIPGNGIDDDGNGYVDDVHGWNALNDNGNIYDPANDDHGTHVAGTIGAAGQNGLGVAGVNWNVTIISGKFLGPNGGTTADAIQAIDYMTDLKIKKGVNIVALNNSWGGGGYDPALLGAIARAAQQQILFVAAAGNGNFFGIGYNTDNSSFYPACYNTTTAAGYDSVISVAAIDKNGAKAGFSNYGANTVDLGAPGVAVWSTVPNGSYASYSGTSMATPHVTGAIALYASSHPAASALDIKNAILDSARATPTSSLAGKTVTGGRLNLSNIIAPPPPAPLAPGGLTATASSSSQIDLAWTDNSDNETGFKIERSNDGINFIQIATVGANILSYSNTGLSSSTPYYYRVRAYNAGGNSDFSNTASATTFTPPSPPPAPSGLTATAVSASQINLTWTDNSDNEDGFRIERKKGSGGIWSQITTVGAGVTAYSNTGLSRRTTYYYRVRAYNSGGNSNYSNQATAKTL